MKRSRMYSFTKFLGVGLVSGLIAALLLAALPASTTLAAPVTGPINAPLTGPMGSLNVWSALPHNGLSSQANIFAFKGTDMYVGGFFTQTADTLVPNLNSIAKFDTTTNTWSALAHNGLDNYVWGLTFSGNILYVGGFFTKTADSAVTNLNQIAQFDTGTNTWSGMAHNGLGGVGSQGVNEITVYGGNLYVGGDFSQTADGLVTNLNNFAIYNIAATTWTTVNQGLDGPIKSMIVHGSDLYVGGGFTKTADSAVTNLNGIAKFNLGTGTWSALPHNGLGPAGADGESVAFNGNDMYVGGWFTQTKDGAVTGLNNIAKFDTTTGTWSALPHNGLDTAATTFVRVVKFNGNMLYAGGSFTQTNDGAVTNLNMIARFDTVANYWSPLPNQGLSNAGPWGDVFDIAFNGSDLYAAGRFVQSFDGTVLNLTNIAAITVEAVPPTVVSTTPADGTTLAAGPSQLTVTFSEDVTHDSLANAANNPANYLLVEDGANGTFDTMSCLGGQVADDTPITVNSVTYNPAIYTATLNVNNGTALPGGRYRLFVCGTTSVEDLAGNKLNGGLSDAQETFSIGKQSVGNLPKTGFPMGQVTILPPQPANLAYSNMGSIWLEIPSLKVKTNIVGVPQSNNVWDVKWLGNDAGWLNGTAFPTWEGNSVITGHVYDSNGLPGPFVNIKDLNYGDRVIVHLYGEKYIFEVRNSRMVRPSTTNFAFEHLEGHAYLTLITCQGYNPFSDSYLFRRIIRTVLVDVQSE